MATRFVFAVILCACMIIYPSMASVMSWFTGGNTPTTPTRIPPEQTRPLNNAGQLSRYPEESGECSHWGYSGPTSYSPGNPTYSPSVGLPLSSGSLIGSHRRAPVGSIVTVTNMKNGNTVRVRVVPPRTTPVFGRVMDLSPAAFAQLESLGEGVFTCSVSVIQPPGRTETDLLSAHIFDNAGVRTGTRPPLFTSYQPMQTSFTEGDNMGSSEVVGSNSDYRSYY